jgi:hypothetical protein
MPEAAAATLDDVTSRSSSNAVAPSAAPAPATPSDVAYKGVSAAMWSEINAQRAGFGDPNDCQARVAAVPTTGTVLQACDGNCINAALASSRTVILRGGTYKPSSIIDLGAGGKLVGAPGETVIIDASGLTEAVRVRNDSVLANVRVNNAIDMGLNFLGARALAYRVSVGRTGLTNTDNANGVGFGVHWGASYNCLVSTEAFDTWNESGQSTVTNQGGNADGYAMKFNAHHNTLIDSHSYRNGDDGIDFWEGGVGYVYFSSAFDNGKTTGKDITGDGNGVKLGIGSVRHNFYKSTAYNNNTNGFSLNGNTVQPLLVQSTAWSNGRSDYANVTP